HHRQRPLAAQACFARVLRAEPRLGEGLPLARRAALPRAGPGGERGAPAHRSIDAHPSPPCCGQAHTQRKRSPLMQQESRELELICMGRAAVDLYGEQIGGRLEDVQTFAKYLGGSPCNTAVGASRLGLKAAMLTRVGD